MIMKPIKADWENVMVYANNMKPPTRDLIKLAWWLRFNRYKFDHFVANLESGMNWNWALKETKIHNKL